MSELAIRAENLGKRYRIGERHRYLALRDVLARTVKAPLRLLHGGAAAPSKNGSAHFWALKDASFEVREGEVVGLIGRNGAGKSTLLKILARITKPTEGVAKIHGRLGSLLEVGTGFHPELTGRENVYMSGAILGMSKREIVRKFDEIVAFAEVEKFIDTPLKHYSSGMQMRLAFAVAAHLDTEIILIDEVLAVGDTNFQKKCLNKMGDVSRQGRTVLLVSHNMAAVATLCSTAVLLDGGRIRSMGPTQDLIAEYLNLCMDRESSVYEVENSPRYYSGLRRQVEFLRLELEGFPTKLVPANTDLRVLITVRGNESVDRFRFSLTIFRVDGSPVGSCFGAEVHSIRKGEVATCRLQLANLGLAPGLYHFGLGVGTGNERTGHNDFDVILDVLHFEVLPLLGENGANADWRTSWGSIRLPEPTTTLCS